MPLHVRYQQCKKLHMNCMQWKEESNRTREPVGTSIPMQGPHQRTSWYFNTNVGTAPENQLALQYHYRDCTGEPVGTAIPMQGLHQRTSRHYNTNAGTAPETQVALQYHCRNCTRKPVGTTIPMQGPHQRPVGTSIQLKGPHQRTSWHFNTTIGTAPENQLALQYQCRDRTREPDDTSLPLL
jgi:hypothetical protein